jgi:hypothetical protein
VAVLGAAVLDREDLDGLARGISPVKEGGALLDCRSRIAGTRETGAWHR